MASRKNNIYYSSFLETGRQKEIQKGEIGWGDYKAFQCYCEYSKTELWALERGHRLVEWGRGGNPNTWKVRAGGSFLAVEQAKGQPSYMGSCFRNNPNE